MKQGKSLLIFLAFFFFTVITFSQEDSIHYSKRAAFGWHVGGVMKQMDFSAIRQYGYFLDQPENISGGIQVALYLGNPDKFFVSIPFGISFRKEQTGTYNNYNIHADGSTGWYGALFSYQIFRNNDHKFFKALYPSVGINYITTTVSSKAQGRGVLNADTSFFYEYSKAKSLLINAEIMIELLNLGGHKNSFPLFPLTLKLGYNMQFQNPKWSYTTTFPNPNDERNINMGGFYAMIGINIWLRPGAAKSWFKPTKK